MKKIVSNVIKKAINNNINMKKNYKLFRILQKIATIDFKNLNNYEDIEFYLKDRTIEARVFNNITNPKGLIIYIHGGGWVLGSKETCTKLCTELLKKTNRIVISINYRLAPEYPFPNGLNDCYECIKIIMDNLNKTRFKNKDICLIGDSAGGNLVAATIIKMRKKLDFRIKKQILLYPSLQADYSINTKYKSVIQNGKDYFLTQKLLEEYMALYIKEKKDLNNPLVSPIKVKIPFLYPKTLIITSDNDPLRDEGIKYAKKLKLYLNNVKCYNIKGAMHGFLTNPFDKNSKEYAYEKILKFLGDTDESKK